jgi:hypothetical protein
MDRQYRSYLHSWFSIFPYATQAWSACSSRKRLPPQRRSHSLPIPESENLVSGRAECLCLCRPNGSQRFGSFLKPCKPTAIVIAFK